MSEPLECYFCHQKLNDSEEADAHLFGGDIGKLCEGAPPVPPAEMISIQYPRQFFPIFSYMGNSLLN